MDILSALELLKKVELKIQELYASYHEMFRDDKTVAGFFFELSLEEKSHADLIDYQIRTVRKNRPSFNDVEFDVERMNSLIAKVDDKIKSGGPAPIESAIEFAIALEDDSVEYQYRTLIAQANSEMGELLKRLGTSDKEHLDKLKALAKRLAH